MHNWKVKSWGSIFTFTVSAGLLLALSQAAPAQTPALGSAPQLAPSNLSCNYLAAADPAVTVYVDEKKLDQAGVMLNGATLVPMRSIFEALGASVKWEGSTRSITATKDETEIILTLGKGQAYINGELKNLSTPAASVGGTTMVPQRFIGEALGAEVKWEGATRTARVTSPTAQSDQDAMDDPNLKITEVVVSPRQALSSGETLTVQVRGDKGCKATFDIVGLKTDIPMHEEKPGLYSGTLTVNSKMKAENAVLVARLSKDGAQTSLEAKQTVTINAKGKIQKADKKRGQAQGELRSENLKRTIPAAGATPQQLKRVRAVFLNEISEGSIRLFLDGREVTEDCTFSANAISYQPEEPIPAGRHQARVRGTDNEGQKIDYSWRFTTKEESQVSDATLKTLELDIPADQESVGATLHLVGQAAPGATVEFEVVNTTKLLKIVTLQKKTLNTKTTADERGHFSAKLDISTFHSGTEITIKVTSKKDGKTLATLERKVTRD